MFLVNEGAPPYLRMIGIHSHTRLTIKSDVYEAFVNLEESFREGLFYGQIALNLLTYLGLRKFHE